MNCIAATDTDRHEATQQIDSLPYCDAHAAQLATFDTYGVTARVQRHVERLQGMSGRRRVHRRARYLARLPEVERILVAQRIAGG